MTAGTECPKVILIERRGVTEMIATKFQRVELDGKSYDLTWYGDKARVSVLTKKGPRTLNGRGRAYRPELIARVISAAQQDARG